MKRSRVGLIVLLILFIIELIFIFIGGFNIMLILSTLLALFTIIDLITDPNGYERREQEKIQIEQNLNDEERAQLLRLKKQRKKGIRLLIVSILLMIMSFLVFIPSLRGNMGESMTTNTFLIVFLSSMVVMTVALFMMSQKEIYYAKMKDKQDQMNNNKGDE